jgi:type IV fimbrial biogenesis protein FimT
MSNTASTPARERGFTIIELMVVLVIIGIVMFLALPSYGRWIANTQIRTAAESIQNGLRLAASEAVSRNTQVDFVLTLDAAPTLASAANAAGQSWVVRVPPPVAPLVAPPAELIDSKPGAEGSRTVVVAAKQAGTATPMAVVSFSGLGRLTPGSAAFQVDFTNPPNADRPLRVTVSTGGRVRMCDPAFPATDPRGC